MALGAIADQGRGARSARVLRVGAVLAYVAHDLRMALAACAEQKGCGALEVRVLLVGALFAEVVHNIPVAPRSKPHSKDAMS